jgi:hypothetical protein
MRAWNMRSFFASSAAFEAPVTQADGRQNIEKNIDGWQYIGKKQVGIELLDF